MEIKRRKTGCCGCYRKKPSMGASRPQGANRVDPPLSASDIEFEKPAEIAVEFPEEPIEAVDESLNESIESAQGNQRLSFWKFFSNQKRAKQAHNLPFRLMAGKSQVAEVVIELNRQRNTSILYCDNQRKPSFIAKFFQFTCTLCKRFSNQILAPQCCSNGICHDCAVKLQSQ